MRLRRSDPSAAGYSRRRRGKGFSYHDHTGAVITDPETVERIRALVIPPAWRDVWICPDPRGHIQAVGTDAAGRRQYRYHDVWRAKRDAAKFDHVLEVGSCLPAVRTVVAEHLAERGLSRNRVLAAAVRLLDVGCFRIGGEEYASGDEATFGLATLRREHVSLPRGAVRFCYPAKGGVERTLEVRDEGVRTVVAALLRRSCDHPDLLAYRNGSGWYDVRSGDINAYLREISGIDISAKDFRTWNGTVLAAVVLAVHELEAASRAAGQPGRAVTKTASQPGRAMAKTASQPGRAVTKTASQPGGAGRASTTTAGQARRRRAVSRAMREVSEYLGNTPAVARASYVDPRVTDLFCDGVTIAVTVDRLGGTPRLQDPVAHQTIEAAVLDMLRTGEEPAAPEVAGQEKAPAAPG